MNLSDKLKVEMKLRDAQYDSLDRLETIVKDERFSFKKNYSENELEAIYKRIWGKGEAFDYAFPSFCFALATGVGKTKLLGACIYMLHKIKGYRNFFVIAPNRTIYDKLIAEFQQTSDKFVFESVTDLGYFEVVTGDDYEKHTHEASLLDKGKFTVFIFNIDKFKRKEGLEVLKINEVLGDSFFNYLSNLPDLVVLMDESHKYKTEKSIEAISSLKPLLGLEFTATPFYNADRGDRANKFSNILNEYPISKAIEDRIVKRPKLYLRKNFDYEGIPLKERYQIMLEDGFRNHENIKTLLEVYFKNNSDIKKRFLPLVLIVCENIEHSKKIEEYLKKDFLNGKYKDRVINIHSESEDEEIEKLLYLEKENNPYEIVINVNKLGLGWDVKNIYTIIPLRAFDSQVFVEQTIGRGIRLPFGKWAEIDNLDSLKVVYHNKFSRLLEKVDAWLANIPIEEEEITPLERKTIQPDNPSKKITIPDVKGSPKVDFTLEYFEPSIKYQEYRDEDILLIVKDLRDKEEEIVGVIKGQLDKSPLEYILSSLISLPRLSAQELPLLERIVKKYFEKIDKTDDKLNLDNRHKIIQDIYEQIKEKIGEKTKIEYIIVGEKKDFEPYETQIKRGSSVLRKSCPEDKYVGNLISGYKKSIFSTNIFDSKQEKIFTDICDDDSKVLKWFRAYTKDNFGILYNYKGDDHSYIPDFIVETGDKVYIVEIKADSEINDEVVQKKKEQAIKWCEIVNKKSKKKWEYKLIPHSKVDSQYNFEGIINWAV
jgi:superfamily II DNA or RNA helicase